MDPLICRYCDRRFMVGFDHAKHEDDCPARPKPAARVASIASARFDRAVHAEDVSPRDAIVAALEWIDACPADEKPTHVIVMIGRDVPELPTASGTKFFQAGTYRHHSQMGLCLEVMHRIRESG